ncbi:MAG: hypothetical protein ACYTDT_08980, partial [Planctomycetota bacterium]
MSFRMLCALFIFSYCTASSLAAADVVWSGSTSGDWALGANWVGASAPGANDVALFDGTGATTTITNASGSLEGIRVDASTPISLGITLSGALTLTGGFGSDAIRLDGSNALTVTNTPANDLVIQGNVFVDGGDLIVTSDVHFGSTTQGTWTQVYQKDGDISFGNVTIVEVITTANGDRSNVEFKRDTGSTGTITMANVLAEGDRTDSAGGLQQEENSGSFRVEDCDLTVSGDVVLEEGTGAVDDEGTGGELDFRDSTVSISGDLIIGSTGSTTSESAANAEIENTTVTFSAGSQLLVRANCDLQLFNATVTGTGAYSIDLNAATNGCIMLNSDVTASAAGNLTISIGCTQQSFLPLAVINCNFSNYDAAGVQIKAGTDLMTLNENTFTGGQPAGSHLTLNGLSAGSTLAADLNQ